MATRRHSRTMPRRQRVWARQLGSISLTGVVGNRGQASLDTQFATEFGTTRLPVGTTIGGIIVQYQSVQTAARAGTTDHYVIGIGVFDETTATETPSPVSDPHADWMWRLNVPIAGTASGYCVSTTESVQGPIRVKAQRKLHEMGDRPWMVVQQVGTTPVDLVYDIGLMLLLP